jgi:ABC-type sugar transport system substrate-binding protein
MRRTRRTTVALVTAATLIVAACGSDDDSSAETSADTTAAPEATEAPDSTEATETTEAPDSTEATESTEAPDSTDGDMAEAGFPECAALDGATIGYSQPIPDPNFAIIDEVMAAQLEVVGAEYLGVNAQFDPGKQVSDIQTLQQQGIDALVINPVDPTVTAAAVQEVVDAGIPVVVQDTDNDGTYYTSVSADVISAAENGVAALKELVGDGPVGAIIGPPFATVLRRQADTFTAAAEEVGLNVIDVQTSGNPGDPGAAQTIAEAWKQQNPDLAGIWTFNDTSAVGVAATFDGDFAPALVSINGQPEAVPLIEGGRISATFDLQQDMIARSLAYAAASAICGIELPEALWVQSRLLDADNVSEWIPFVERGVDSALSLEEIDGKTFIVQS